VQLLAVCLTSFLMCAAGALIPVLNTEVYLIGAGAPPPPPPGGAPVVARGRGGVGGRGVLLY
jgi:hypothetical protein